VFGISQILILSGIKCITRVVKDVEKR
jgi:hypothetical protein